MHCTLIQFNWTTRTHCTNTTYLLSLDTIQYTSTTLHMHNLLHLCTTICCSTNQIVPSLSFMLILRVEVLKYILTMVYFLIHGEQMYIMFVFSTLNIHHKELRHNIGKQLCLHASPYPEPVKIELCTLKGKGSSLTPQQEWVFTEVSVLSECLGLLT